MSLAVPITPQSNGMAGRMVKTAKSLLEKSADPYLALLANRTTPLPWCGLSPAQLLMGRPLRTDIPQVPSTLIPQWPYLTNFCQKDAEQKRKQKAGYDRRHRARFVLPLPNNQAVWVRTRDRPDLGRVIQSADTPRSYLVETPSGTVQRNQSHLARRPKEDSTETTPEMEQRHTIATRSQTGARRSSLQTHILEEGRCGILVVINT